tara:strand:- start:58 stop:960 length:903 start_codon:yes stop_codon:yes gene_type:complete
MWFVEIIDTGDNYVTRYIPVRANSMAEASAAARATGLESWERIGTIASRLHFEGQGVKNLPSDSAAINAGGFGGIGGLGEGGTDEAARLAALEAARLAALETAAGFGDPAGDEGLRREAFEFGPGFEAGLRDRNINIGPGGGLQGAIAQSRQRALEDRFYTQEALQPGSGLTTENAFPTFQRFLSGRTGDGDTFTNPLFGQAGAQAARGLLNQARGFGSPGTEALPSDLAGRLLNPATTGQGQTLANVALEAGRQRFGSLSRFLPNAEALSQSFLAQDRPTAGQPVPLTFANYLNQRIFG